MNSVIVIYKRCFAYKCSFTNKARKRFIPLMNWWYVPLHMFLPWKSFMTNWALKFFPFMNSFEMSVQITFSGIASITVRTLFCFLSLMYKSDVLSQCILCYLVGLANWARQWFWFFRLISFMNRRNMLWKLVFFTKSAIYNHIHPDFLSENT